MSPEVRAQIVRQTPSDLYALCTLARLLSEAQVDALEVDDLDRARECRREWAAVLVEYRKLETLPIGMLW
jgi:hypothetical protein